MLCGGNGKSKLKQDAAAIDCTADPCGGANFAADAALCCYDPRFDQRTAGADPGNFTASLDTLLYADPGVQEITALRGAATTRAVADGGRAHTSQLVAECDITSDSLPTTQSIGDVPLQGGSATYWKQITRAYDRLTAPCPAAEVILPPLILP